MCRPAWRRTRQACGGTLSAPLRGKRDGGQRMGSCFPPQGLYPQPWVLGRGGGMPLARPGTGCESLGEEGIGKRVVGADPRGHRVRNVPCVLCPSAPPALEGCGEGGGSGRSPVRIRFGDSWGLGAELQAHKSLKSPQPSGRRPGRSSVGISGGQPCRGRTGGAPRAAARRWHSAWAAGSPEEPLGQRHGAGVKTCSGRPPPGLTAP